MNIPQIPRVLAFLVSGTAFLVGFQPSARAEKGAEFMTAVSSTAYKGYVREKLPDGTLKPEYYSFGDGGKMVGQMDDDTIDNLAFPDVARMLAQALAGQKYLAATDPKTTGLLIMLYWGTTHVDDPIQDSATFLHYQDVRNAIGSDPLPAVPSGKPVPTTINGSLLQAMNNPPSGTDDQMAALADAVTMMNMENEGRIRTDFGNAKLLGYDNFEQAGLVSTDFGVGIGHTPLGLVQHDETLEVERPRYFVILMAYDFQMMWKEKKHRLLWEARFSINQPHNDFTKALPAMANYASRYFGKNSHGLVRESIREGNVSVGEPTLVELLSTPSK